MSKGRNSSGQFSKGNTCAKGNKGKGKYKREYVDMMLNFFAKEPGEKVDYPMFEGFAKRIGVTVRTLENWGNAHAEFGEAMERCRDAQRRHLVLGGLVERFNPAFAKFLLGCQGMSDKNATAERDDPTGASGGLDVVITLLSEREKDDGEKKT